jgi:penicillin-binding protein 2
MDIHTGDVRVMVSNPGFDPNLFSNPLSVRDWKRLNDHPRTPLLNRVTSGLYAPGSTFKMVVIAAALEAGVISTKTRYECTGGFDFGDTTFHCWNKRGHGTIDGVQALEQSCDIYFYQIALKTGIDRIHNMARRLGLGDVTGIGLPGEKPGIIPQRSWKMQSRGTAWTPGETVIAGIGQGFVLTTPLQLAVMTARIANGKYAVTPRLQADNKPVEFAPLEISPAIIRVLRKGMRAVTNGPRGTARKHDVNGVGMAGKTGTVQVKRITKEQREKGIVDNIDRPWKERDHALFVAYAPFDDPRYAMSVVVEHGGSGSSMAAPIAKDIMSYLLEQDTA